MTLKLVQTEAKKITADVESAVASPLASALGWAESHPWAVSLIAVSLMTAFLAYLAWKL